MLFDTHAHLNLDIFLNKEKIIVEESKNNGILAILVPGIDLKTSKKSIELSQKYEIIYSAIGFHPLEIEKLSLADFDFYWQELSTFFKQEKVVALGEIGLDKIKGQESFDKQVIFFQQQLNLAEEFNKPVIIHNRRAAKEVINILEKLKFRQQVIFHCVEPDDLILEFALKNDCYLGFDGDITYNRKKQAFIKKVPLNLILLETDSPFLLPEPLKIYPNQPKNLKLILDFVSRLLDKDLEKLNELFWQNSCQAFGLKLK